MSLGVWAQRLVRWSQGLLFLGISVFPIPAVMALPPSWHLLTSGMTEAQDEPQEWLILVGRGGGGKGGGGKQGSDLNVSPTGLQFSAEGGQSTSMDQTLTIERARKKKGSTSWSVSSPAPWLTVTPASGETSRETDVVTVTADPSQLAPGTYETMITITASGSSTPKQVQVTMTVTDSQAPMPTISQSPTVLTFSAEEGAPTLDSQLLNIQNTGGSTLSWSLLENASWLHLGATSGTTTTETDSVNVSVDTNGLAAGSYSATVSVVAQDASNSPVQVPVSLTIAAAPPPPPTDTSATLSWDPNTEEDLAGYNVYVGMAPGDYDPPTHVGTVTSHEIQNLTPGYTYYFTVTAIDTAGNESPKPPERSKSIY